MGNRAYVVDMARPEVAMDNQNQKQPEKKTLKLNVKVLSKKTATTVVCAEGGGGGCGRAGNPAVAFH